jgi:hypothetical protein
MPHTEIELYEWKARAEKAEAERDALKCCANCGHGYEESDYMWCEGPMTKPGNESPIMSPRHVCPEWKAREP